MKITETMLVADGVKDDEADTRRCSQCGGNAFFVPQRVMVFSGSGARRMRLWACEIHPLPEQITDEP
jgi:ribosomal protein L37E